MAFSFIIHVGLGLLMTFSGGAYAEKDVEDPAVSNLFVRYGCCSRIDHQTTILKGVSSATEKLTKDVGEMKAGIEGDIPSELKRQAVDLEKLSSEVKGQSVDLKGVKASVSEIAISLNRHTEDLLVHDARMKELGLLLEKMNKVINDVHGSLAGPKDCSDIRAMGNSTSGVYRVYPGSLTRRIQAADVYCDTTTPGGNWLVFQRRKDGSVDFERTWIEYKDGFGNPGGEFWLGNEALHLLTSNRKYKLRIDMEDFDGKKRYAEYSTFSVGSSTDKYRLTVSGYKGDAGDSFSFHNGMKFSTKDEDNDSYAGDCTKLYRGAWWHGACHHSNLNGLYLRGPHKSYADGIEWYTYRGHYYSMKMTEMKIAAVN